MWSFLFEDLEVLMNIFDRINRIDSKEKINGQGKYIEDIQFENLHFARTLRSTIPKGKIVGVKYPEGYEGICIVDARDVYRNQVHMIDNEMPVFADEKVSYIGEPIALVVGKDKNNIIRFMNQIEVYYEEETGIFSIDECRGKTEQIISSHRFEKGNIDSLDYDDLFEREYTTGYQEQLYMEKQGLVGDFCEGTVTIYGSMQCPYYIKNALLHCMDLSPDHIRVIQVLTGGAFGGKEEYPSLMACQVAAAAKKIGAPVRLVFDRREDITYTTKRHPSHSIIKTYLKNGSIVGMAYKVELDGGPYAGLTDVVLQRALLTMTGCYRIDHFRAEGISYKTNNIFTGAFRGFGGPQSMFALEQHMNQLARYLQIDPIDFRRRYFVKKGDYSATSGEFHEDIFLDRMADKLKALSDYQNKIIHKEPYHGFGVSFIPHGGGFTGDGEANHIKGVVKLVKNAEGEVSILVSSVEMGQGAKTVLSKIVASVLDIDIHRIIYHNPDTAVVPDSGPTVASRTTMVVGNLLFRAAKKLKDKMNCIDEVVVEEHYIHPDYMVWDQDKLKGNAYLSYSWSAVAAEVIIDPLTYEITCTDIYGVYDVGTPIDKSALLGQIHGGIAQGLGYGMMEVMTSNQGLIQHNSFSSYTVPTMSDMPIIHSECLMNPYQDGPFGAKAAGELTLVGVAPAIAAAVEDALGFEMNHLPITPELIAEVVLK
jgi:CO/xanthine dehydrogenase Mo-binding subunit